MHPLGTDVFSQGDFFSLSIEYVSLLTQTIARLIMVTVLATMIPIARSSNRGLSDTLLDFRAERYRGAELTIMWGYRQ
jgi:hypothetical protein